MDLNVNRFLDIQPSESFQIAWELSSSRSSTYICIAPSSITLSSITRGQLVNYAIEADVVVVVMLLMKRETYDTCFIDVVLYECRLCVC